MDKKEMRGLMVILAITGLILIGYSTVGQVLLAPSATGDSMLGQPSSRIRRDVEITSSLSNYVPLEVNPMWDNIDQENYIAGDPSNFAIHYSPNTWGVAQFTAQMFQNDGEPMTGFQMLISWWDGNGNGEVTEPLYIGVSKILSYDPADWRVVGYITANQISPRTKYWVGMDLSDNPIDLASGAYAYLMAVSPDSLPADLSDGGWWCVGGNYTVDTYPRGMLYINNDASDNWEERPDWDLYFKTYTPQGSGHDAPIVTASSDYWIATAFGGGLSLLGAVAVFIRYLTMGG